MTTLDEEQLQAHARLFYFRHLKTQIARMAACADDKAAKFRADGGKYAQSVAYDAGKRMIVVTLGDRFRDQRCASHAEEKDGTIVWTCRTIDLEPKYLPAASR